MRGALLSSLALALVAASTSATAIEPPLTPPQYRRAPDNTFLTYPEWFLVYSPDEYARFVRTRSPDAFPFWGHTRQLWAGYFAMARAARAYPTNWGYHAMIGVIATSTTMEYSLRAAYETVIGRLSALDGRAEEDDFGAGVAREYVDFLAQKPWYEFPFAAKGKKLWSDTRLVGPHLLRKWERKYALTTEYAAKAFYGWLIGQTSAGAYGVERPDTAVVLESLPRAAYGTPGVTVLQRFDDGRVLVSVPRYDAFKGAALALARAGATFVEVAGNRGPILITVQAPASYAPRGYEVIFAQPILTVPGRRRLAVSVPVARLHKALLDLSASPLLLEHVYDY